MEDLIGYLREARRILVFTGAGISTGSGIPDFRGPDGVWKKRQPVYYQDFMASEEARIEHWDYKFEGWEAFRDATPNPVHHAIVDLEKAGKLEMLVTQNIDGLHEAAGTSRERLVEIHGSNSRIECQSCHALTAPEPHFVWFAEHRACPRCECGGFLKPATISFGQAMPEEPMMNAFRAARNADMAVALGTTLSVQPASGIPLLTAELGYPYVVINRGPTDHDQHKSLSLRLEGDVVELFPSAVGEVLENV